MLGSPVAALRRLARGALLSIGIAAAALVPDTTAGAEPLQVGYSDWPGWVAWQVAIDKGWLEAAGLDIRFQWFNYAASIEAFAAGKLDAVTVTNGDALVLSGNGAPNIMILLTDYSNGNDMIIGRPDTATMADLKGKKVGLELGLVEHLLLINGLNKAGLSESDVTLVNARTHETPRVLGSGDVAAVGAWQPIAGEAMRGSPGSHPLYTSADQPGLIYDVLAVSPASLAARRADWIKLTAIWDRIVGYIDDPKTQPDAVRIMAARVGVAPATYLDLLKGTKLLDLVAGKAAMVDGQGFGSLYGSSRNADTFNVANQIYKDPQPIDESIDPNVTAGR